jgi:hypothetical protein
MAELVAGTPTAANAETRESTRTWISLLDVEGDRSVRP